MVMAYHFVMLVAQPECHTVGAGAWWRRPHEEYG